MGINLDQIHDERLRQRIWKALNAGGPELDDVTKRIVAQPLKQPARPSISTDEAKLNKTERAFLEWLRAARSGCWIGIQNITLKLADDTRYTPDFSCVGNQDVLHFWEVKGFWRDDARVKIKVAARMFPWARFTAVQRIKGQWNFEEIKP